MNVILAPVKWQTNIDSPGDIETFWKTPEEHIVHVKQAIAFLQRAGMTSHFKKFRFSIDKVDYLWHLMRPQSPDITVHTTDAKRKQKRVIWHNEAYLRAFVSSSVNRFPTLPVLELRWSGISRGMSQRNLTFERWWTESNDIRFWDAHITTLSSVTIRWRALFDRYRCMRRTSRYMLLKEQLDMTMKRIGYYFQIPYEGREGVWDDTAKTFCKALINTSTATLLQRK